MLEAVREHGHELGDVAMAIATLGPAALVPAIMPLLDDPAHVKMRSGLRQLLSQLASPPS